jgi:arylsulfatase A-like enzyme
MDENVGRVLDYLKKNDLEKNTIVIYSSDQGFYICFSCSTEPPPVKSIPRRVINAPRRK